MVARLITNRKQIRAILYEVCDACILETVEFVLGRKIQILFIRIKTIEFDITTLSFGDFRRNKAIGRAETGRHFFVGRIITSPSKGMTGIGAD